MRGKRTKSNKKTAGWGGLEELALTSRRSVRGEGRWYKKLMKRNISDVYSVVAVDISRIHRSWGRTLTE